MPASESNQGLVLTRVFDAPRPLVFRAWTETEHLVHWWGQPRGATMPYCTVDLRVGGRLHYRVNLPDGNVAWGLGIYEEIVEPKRLAFADYFSDEAGNIAEAPPGLPRETRIVVSFEDLGGRTKVTAEHRGVERASAEIQALYRQSWSESLDRLGEHLGASAAPG